MDKTIEMYDIYAIDINHNTIHIQGYKKGLFGRRKPVFITLGLPGRITTIIDKECVLAYPKDKILQSHRKHRIKLGEIMD